MKTFFKELQRIFRLKGRLTLLSLIRVRVLTSRNFHDWPIGPGLVRLRIKALPHPFYIRAKGSDAYVAWSSLVLEEYSALPACEDATIVDLGANIGASSLYFLKSQPNCRIIAVECAPENFLICEKNLKPYAGQIATVMAPIWSADNVPIQISSSGFRDGLEWSRQALPAKDLSQKTIRSLSINQLIRDFAITRINILKIDIEGAEENLFSQNLEWLNIVDNIAIELHGNGCAKSFFRAMEGYDFEKSEQGEYTICRNIRAKTNSSKQVR